jgi:hypothetical protein
MRRGCCWGGEGSYTTEIQLSRSYSEVKIVFGFKINMTVFPLKYRGT